jgi:hypothetical protein
MRRGLGVSDHGGDPYANLWRVPLVVEVAARFGRVRANLVDYRR